MREEELSAGKGTCLRRNNFKNLIVSISCHKLNKIMVINGSRLITKKVKEWELEVSPNEYYMIINVGKASLSLNFNNDISEHEIIYNPYKYEYSKKTNINPDTFIKQFSVPNRYVDILSKWYSIKFTYPKYNLIFIKPEMGISIQIHTDRSEEWEIIRGKPIIINNNKIYYFVEHGTKFKNEKMQYHSIINPNKNPNDFVILKERWSGSFDEEDIKRIFNPNNYQ